jgi:hypothetical protein
MVSHTEVEVVYAVGYTISVTDPEAKPTGGLTVAA